MKLATELSRTSTGKPSMCWMNRQRVCIWRTVNDWSPVLRQLAKGGNSVLIIEHNLDVIKACDYVIDLGPEGGNGGGTLVCEGTPEEICDCEKSYTGQFLKPALEKKVSELKSKPDPPLIPPRSGEGCRELRSLLGFGQRPSRVWGGNPIVPHAKHKKRQSGSEALPDSAQPCFNRCEAEMGLPALLVRSEYSCYIYM